MRSYLLNGAMGDIRPPAIDVTHIPVNGGVVVEGPPQRANGFDIEKAKKWYESGKALHDAGMSAGTSFNFGAAFAAAGAGAAAGALIGGVGAVAGAIVAVAVYVVNVFSQGGPSEYDAAGPNVHWFFENFAPQAFKDYVDATGSVGAFASVQDAARAYIVWRLTAEGRVLWPGHVWYSGIDDERYVWFLYGGADPYSPAQLQAAYDAVEKLYSDLGVDFHSTTALYNEDGGYGGAMMMKNRVLVEDAPVLPEVQGDADAGTVGKIVLGLAIAGGAAYIATR